MPAQNGAEDWHAPEKDDKPSLVGTFSYVAQCPMKKQCTPKAEASVESNCEVLTEQEEYEDRRQCRPRKRDSDYDCATTGTKSSKKMRAAATSWELLKCTATCTGLADMMCNLCVTFACEFEGATELLKDQMVNMSEAAGPNDDASND